jgi:hypothetical protein
MAASVVITRGCMAGSTAIGIAEFHRRRADFPVADCARVVCVLFTTGTGMQASGFVLGLGFRYIVGCWLCIFWHSFTNRTVAKR